LAKRAGTDLGFTSLGTLRAAMYQAAPQLAALNILQKADAAALAAIGDAKGKPTKAAFTSPIKNFYLTNPIARASRIMAECSALKNGQQMQAAE
ncbi:MAG TPA: NADH-quinone oxidoreductase subunit G, partial [Aestuariivirga sp.]